MSPDVFKKTTTSIESKIPSEKSEASSENTERKPYSSPKLIIAVRPSVIDACLNPLVLEKTKTSNFWAQAKKQVKISAKKRLAYSYRLLILSSRYKKEKADHLINWYQLIRKPIHMRFLRIREIEDFHDIKPSCWNHLERLFLLLCTISYHTKVDNRIKLSPQLENDFLRKKA